MKILFTKSQSPLSKAIRAITDEPVSHVALSFSFGGFSLVVHSNLLGLHLESQGKFLQHAEIVHTLKLKIPEDSGPKLKELLEKYEYSLYDFGALFFIGISLFLRSKFRIPLPKSNLWQSSGMFLCTEWATQYIDGTSDSMITPYKLFLRLYDSGKWDKKNTLNAIIEL